MGPISYTDNDPEDHPPAGTWSSSGSFTQNYAGSLTRHWTVTVTRTGYQTQHTGTYHGTLRHSFKQGFSAPFTREKADRYVIYISDNTINNMADINQLSERQGTVLCLDY